MKFIEIYWWNSLFWLLYMPISLIIYLFTLSGSIGGIVLIGFGISVVFSGFLAPLDGVLYRPRRFKQRPSVAPQITHHSPTVKQEQPKKKRGRPKKSSVKPVLQSVSNQPPEVDTYEKKKEEVAPKLRTDVDLNSLAVDVQHSS